MMTCRLVTTREEIGVPCRKSTHYFGLSVEVAEYSHVRPRLDGLNHRNGFPSVVVMSLERSYSMARTHTFLLSIDGLEWTGQV